MSETNEAWRNHLAAVKDSTNITDLIGSETGQSALLRGGNGVCRCPFHEDASPSLSVSDAKGGVYNCHAAQCGAKGDAIQFVIDYHGMSFRDAIDYLGDRAGLPRYESGETRNFTPKPRPAAARAPSATNLFPDRPDQPPEPSVIPDHVTLPAPDNWVQVFNPRAYEREKERGGTGVKNYKPERADIYRLEDGQPTAVVMRLRFADGRKFYMPLRYGQLDDEAPDTVVRAIENGARMGWVVGGYSKGALAPIYNENLLPGWARSCNPQTARVLLVEGEKTAEAAMNALGPGYHDTVVLTPLGGGSSPGMGDWRRAIDHFETVAARLPADQRINLMVWPDADPVIERANDTIDPQRLFTRKVLYGINDDLNRRGRSLSDIFDCYRVTPPDGVPKGWDLADAVEEGWGRREIINHLSRELTYLRVRAAEPSATADLPASRNEENIRSAPSIVTG